LASWEDRLRSARQAALAAESNARTFWAERGFTMMADSFVALPLFVNALPFCSDRKAVRDSGRYRTATTEHAARLTPIFADWRGTGTPALNLIGRNGQLMNVCLFDSQTNYNTVVAAQSGSGKSFLANHLIESYLGAGAYVWVIDAGYSYLKLAEELGGDFIDFAPDKPVSLNPFPIVREYDEEGDILEAVVTAMAAPTEPLTDLQSSELKRAMRDLWAERGGDTSIDAVAAKLHAHEDERVRDIGTRLYGFTSEGAYGRYFHGPNTVSFRNRFTVLELDQLRSRKHLQQVVLLMLIYAVQQQMHSLPRGVKKIVLIDEAWELLGEGEVGKFIEHAYRRFRKYNGAAVTVTQSIADFHTSASGRAVAENSANRFLLGQKSEVLDTLVAGNKLALNAFSLEVLKSVHTLAGQYSEIYVQTEGGSGVGRLIVPPFSRLLYSTRPEDLAAIARHRETGMTTQQAIAAVLAERAPRVTARGRAA
jgi:conjugal transfer ATP-binding protein TraC